MLSGFIEGLIIAWILSLFKVDDILINALQPFTQVRLNTSMYYMAFAMMGVIGSLFESKHVIEIKKDKED